jgi:hypothetical protein
MTRLQTAYKYHSINYMTTQVNAAAGVQGAMRQDAPHLSKMCASVSKEADSPNTTLTIQLTAAADVQGCTAPVKDVCQCEE